MEKLNSKQQAEVGKMSTERLLTKLAKLGYDEELVATADRSALLNMYAEYILSPPPAATMEGGPVKGGTMEEELALRRQDLQLRMMEIEEAKKPERKNRNLKKRQGRKNKD